jgi:sodium transport system permease protein
MRLPRWDLLVVAGVLACACHPLSLELAASLHWFFPPLPKGVTELMHSMADPHQPWWQIVAAFAFVPAVCEEIAFRGFILTGFQRSGRTWLAIVMSSLAFGIMHMIPQQVFNAALLGLVLGLVAVHTRSLIPCILFHFVFNSLAVLHGRFGEAWKETPLDNPFIRVVNGQIRYPAPTLFLCAVLVTTLLWYLVRQPKNSGSPLAEPVDVPLLNGPVVASR